MSMSHTDKTYADTLDGTIVSVTPSSLLDQWNRFEEDVFAKLSADETIRRHILLNAGAGRRITDTEAPFFSSFTERLLLEPDAERRANLAQDERARGAALLSDRIENLNSNVTADFVQCKYVLQHIHTDVFPQAIERLKSAVANDGAIGIFSTISPDHAFFQMSVPESALHRVPDELKADAHGNITKNQFNTVIASPPDFPFIATHYIDVNELMSPFRGWDTSLMRGPSNVAFLLARKSGARRGRPLLSKIKELFR